MMHGGKYSSLEDFKISVIVPIYKVEPYLQKCIDSILAQTYHHLEIILVDDGSPDCCGSICDEYARRDSRVIVIHKQNGGLSDARNAGLLRASGDYIGFVDSDDWIETDMFETLLDLSIRNDADITICGTYRVVCDAVALPPYSLETSDTSVYEEQDAVIKLCEDQDIHSHVWNKLFRRKLFNTIHFPIGQFFEDIFIMHELFGQANRVVFSREPKYYYLERTGSIVGSISYQDKLHLAEGHDARLAWVQKNCPAAIQAEELIRLQTGLYIYNLFAHLPLKAYLHAHRTYLRDLYQNTLQRSHSEVAESLSLSKRLQLNVLRHSSLVYFGAEKVTHFIKRHAAAEQVFSIGMSTLCRWSQRPVPLYFPPHGQQKRIFLIGLPEYNNLGDHAIGYAESLYIKNELPEYELIEVTEKQFRDNRRRIRHALCSGDVVALLGGGNFGNQYPDQENLRQWVIRNCQHNRIIIFPQTMYFTPDNAGKVAEAKAARIYNSHPDLAVLAREKFSYSAMKRLLPHCKVALTPDIVLYLNPIQPKTLRDGVGLCLRSDLESRINAIDFVRMNRACREIYGKVRHFDTCLSESISVERRAEVLERIWKEFGSYRLIVTDRLHGAIFAAITGTPCIAIGNYNHKIRGICDWLKDLGYIHYAECADQVPALLKELPLDAEATYDRSHFRPLFQSIQQLVRQ